MSSAECYVDETQTTAPRSVFAAAGMVLQKDRTLLLSENWHKMLSRWSLPYFHMTDCALHQGIYKHLTLKECDLAAREAISAIRNAVSAYVYVTVDVEAYAGELEPLGIGTLYEWSAFCILPSVARWCASNPNVIAVHYYFEDGAKGRSDARSRIMGMMQSPKYRADCRYTGMSFVRKEQSPGAQAADLIAWHAGKDAKRAFAGEGRRKDFDALIKNVPAYGCNWTSLKIKGFRSAVLSMAPDFGLPVEEIPHLARLARRAPKR